MSNPRRLRDGMLTEAERSGILALHSFLREEDPNHERLGLKRIPTYTGDYLWLCETHYEQLQSKIPDKIEWQYEQTGWANLHCHSNTISEFLLYLISDVQFGKW